MKKKLNIGRYGLAPLVHFSTDKTHNSGDKNKAVYDPGDRSSIFGKARLSTRAGRGAGVVVEVREQEEGESTKTRQRRHHRCGMSTSLENCRRPPRPRNVEPPKLYSTRRDKL
ncbi:hypothetical protein GWI33_004874 [Rhynchophorus ferrugineus]|uniref:Uncharacterized protein n=1 Tax=Rhynchophorus ferrugineus TaxID=354439 RepID=A0A834IK40_RHYFE|nr:hypothetical protein GWI33_004874 [Rhynchophorus ferrugineus]